MSVQKSQNHKRQSKSNNEWLDEMINIMYYLFPHDFSNSKMKDKNEEQKWNYVDLYWKKKHITF